MTAAPIQFRSQAGQDRWIHQLLVLGMGIRAGSFLDIGACHPINYSNTYALEQMGWRGLLVDNDSNAMNLCAETRPQASTFCVDATTFNWRGFLPTVFAPGRLLIDYLSLDVDGATADTLHGLLESSYSFRAATIEHDAYRFGPVFRDRIRADMKAHGYEVICQDVMSNGMAFEDWWVDPRQVDMEKARFFTCSGVEGTVIVQ